MIKRVLTLFCLCQLIAASDLMMPFPQPAPSTHYGVDNTFPIHHPLSNDSYFGSRHVNLMNGCYNMYSRSSCDEAESFRIQSNLDQPKSQYNYTEVGFKKLRVPIDAWKPLIDFWEANKGSPTLEEWTEGNIITNNWESPTYMVSLEDDLLQGSGAALKQKIWDGVKPILEEWVGHKIYPTSMYGIRIYTNNSVLATHVDRLPLVTSCIINVDQDVDEDWPIEVYSHDGRAHNITMKPGDMVLYESATVLHGRPFPMKGRAYANIFVHFQPIDHPSVDTDASISVTQTALHTAAAEGDEHEVRTLLSMDSQGKLLHAKDVNHWQPIHEAVRSGNLEIVRILVEQGADLHSVTHTGGSALWWAKKELGTEHEVVEYLEMVGAPDLSSDEL